MAINMVEAGAKEVPEEVMLEAIMFGHEEIKKLIAFQEEIAQASRQRKREVILYELDHEVTQAVEAFAKEEMVEAIQIEEKQARYDAIDAIKNKTIEHFAETFEDKIKDVKEVLDKIVKEEVRRLITHDKVRPDGTKD